MRRAPADGVVRRRHHRDPADDDFGWCRKPAASSASAEGGSARILQREHGAGLLQEMAFIAFFNAGFGARYPRPYHPREVGYFIPSITAGTDKRCVPVNGSGAPRSRSRPTMSRPTIAATSYGRSRQYGHACPRTDRRGAWGRRTGVRRSSTWSGFLMAAAAVIAALSASPLAGADTPAALAFARRPQPFRRIDGPPARVALRRRRLWRRAQLYVGPKIGSCRSEQRRR